MSFSQALISTTPGVIKAEENEQRKNNKRKYTKNYPLQGNPYYLEFKKKYSDMDIEQITRSESIPSLSKVCEIRDSTDTTPQTALQACQLILNKVLPDKIGPWLDVKIDLNKLLEVYGNISRHIEDKSSNGIP